MKTIKQLADELGVSKTAIRNYMDDDFRAKHTAKDGKGVITITPDGCKLISENFGNQPGNTGKNSAETELITIPRSVLKLLEDQIREKDEQLKVKDQQIAALTRLTDQAQTLHAGTIKKSLPEISATEDSDIVSDLNSAQNEEPPKKKVSFFSWLFPKGE